MGDTLDKFGVQGSFVSQYFGVAFLLVATVVALLPAGQVGAAADEETSGRLVHVLTRTTRRTRVGSPGGSRLGRGSHRCVGLLAGVGSWLGAKSQGVDVSFTSMLGAGLNVVPIAFVALGVGAVVLSIVPRAAATTVYSIVVWSLVVDLSASLVSGLGWLEHVSLFHYMALAPAQSLEPAALAVTTAVAVGLCVAATSRFCHRDLQPA